jgi:hypothetical protein
VCVIIFAIYREIKRVLWNRLRKNYLIKDNYPVVSAGWKESIMFLWDAEDYAGAERREFMNVVFWYADEYGMYIKYPFYKFFGHTIFIPWKDLQFKGWKRVYYFKCCTLLVCQLNVFLLISNCDVSGQLNANLDIKSQF